MLFRWTRSPAPPCLNRGLPPGRLNQLCLCRVYQVHRPDPLRCIFPHAMLALENFMVADDNQGARRNCSSAGAGRLRSARARSRRASSGTHRCILNRLSCRIRTAVNPRKINRMPFWNRLSNGPFQQVLFVPFDRHCSSSGPNHLITARTRSRRGPSVTRRCFPNRLSKPSRIALNPNKIMRVQFRDRPSYGRPCTYHHEI